MNCKEFLERISDYIDSELEEDLREAVDSHLSQCPNCVRLMKEMLTLTDQLARLPRLRPTTGFDFSLRSLLSMEISKEMHWKRRRFFLVAAAVLILAVGLGAFYNQIWISKAPEPRAAFQKSLAPSVERGALKRIYQEESYSLSQQLYGLEHYLTDSHPQLFKPLLKKSTTSPETKRVTVRF